MATGIDAELKRLNTRRIQEHNIWLAKATTTAKVPAIWPTASLSTSVRLTSTGFLLLQCPNLTSYSPLPSATLALESNPSPRCYNCQEIGHVSCDCPKLWRVPTIKDIKEEELAEFKELEDKSASQRKAQA